MLQITNPTLSTSQSLVPEEAYLFFPREKEIRRMTSQGGERIIFEGCVEYDASEKAHIRKFLEEVKKKSSFNFPEDWPESETLRFLQANGFKYKPTLKSMQEYIQWKQAIFPVALTPTIEKYLQKGIVYVFGRDCRMRPILVMNGHLMNPKNIDIDTFLEMLTFLLDFVIRELLLPGQIENWHVIGDLNGCGITELPIAALKKIFIYLQSHYRSRLYKLHIFNAPNSIVLPWKMARGFIEEATREKVHFYKEGSSAELWREINPAQVEQKFGGKVPNLTSYWPLTPCPKGFEGTADCLSTSLVSREKYYELWSSGLLKGHKISQDIIKSVESQKSKLDISEVKIKRRSISQKQDSRDTATSEIELDCDHCGDTDESANLNKIVHHSFSMKPMIIGNWKRFANLPLKRAGRSEQL